MRILGLEILTATRHARLPRTAGWGFARVGREHLALVRDPSGGVELRPAPSRAVLADAMQITDGRPDRVVEAQELLWRLSEPMPAMRSNHLAWQQRTANARACWSLVSAPWRRELMRTSEEALVASFGVASAQMS